MKKASKLLCIAASFALTMGAVSPASSGWLPDFKEWSTYFWETLFSDEKQAPAIPPGVHVRDASTGEYWLQMSEDCVGLLVLRCAQYDIKLAKLDHALRVYLTRYNNQKLYIVYQDSHEPFIEDGVVAVYGREAGAEKNSFIRLTKEDLTRIKDLDNPYTKALDTIEGFRGEKCTFTLSGV